MENAVIQYDSRNSNAHRQQNRHRPMKQPNHLKTTVIAVVVPLLVSIVLVRFGIAKWFVILPAVTSSYLCTSIAMSRPDEFHPDGKGGPIFFAVMIPLFVMMTTALFAALSLEDSRFIQVTIANTLGTAWGMYWGIKGLHKSLLNYYYYQNPHTSTTVGNTSTPLIPMEVVRESTDNHILKPEIKTIWWRMLLLE